MDIEDLKTFVAAVRHGSFSKAARQMNISQPAISRRIHKLEQEVGAPLLTRSGGAFTPTRHGLEFLHFARRTLAEYDALLESVGQDVPVQGRIQISASSTPGEHLLPGVLARFHRLYPQVSTTLHVMDSAAVEHCVIERHCDIGFVGRPTTNALLRQTEVGSDEIVLAVPKIHPLANESRVRLAQLEDEAFVRRQAGSGTHESVESILRQRGLAMPQNRAVLETTSVHSQIEAIAAGHGVGFVSKLAVRPHMLERVALLRLEGVVLDRSLYMLYRDDRQDRPFWAFVEYVKEARLTPDFA